MTFSCLKIKHNSDSKIDLLSNNLNISGFFAANFAPLYFRPFVPVVKRFCPMTMYGKVQYVT